MGHVYVEAVFYNPFEYMEYAEGRRRLEDVRRVEEKALVDTGATFPALPRDLVEKLGLSIVTEGEAEASEGKGRVKLTLTIVQVEDRTAGTYTIIRPEGTTPLIGVVALEQMGFKVDPATGKLIKGLPIML